MEPDLIKKAKINYFSCQLGGMHEGEKMSFVCVDANCKSKGLICPVCKEIQHSDHQVLHLKIFLNKISQQYPTDSQENSLNNVTQQLNRLQNYKKTMISTLKENVKSLADMVKKVQQKIQDNYLILRRVILSQSTVPSKIPNLYNNLTSGEKINEEEIKLQIRKCSELMEMKNSKVQMVNESSKLLDQYSKNSDTFIAHLTNIIADLPKKFEELPLKVKKIGLGNQQSTEKVQYKFSPNHKAQSLNLSQNQKIAFIPIESDGIGGLAFTNFEQNKNIKKVNFKINQSVSESISLGIANPQVFKGKDYVLEMENEGLFGICSMGIVLNDYDTPSFVFSQGDIIEIVFDVEQAKLTFSRRNGIEKQEIHPPINKDDAEKMTFFCGLVIPGDEVSIIQ